MEAGSRRSPTTGSTSNSRILLAGRTSALTRCPRSARSRATCQEPGHVPAKKARSAGDQRGLHLIITTAGLSDPCGSGARFKTTCASAIAAPDSKAETDLIFNKWGIVLTRETRHLTAP